MVLYEENHILWNHDLISFLHGIQGIVYFNTMEWLALSNINCWKNGAHWQALWVLVREDFVKERSEQCHTKEKSIAVTA